MSEFEQALTSKLPSAHLATCVFISEEGSENKSVMSITGTPAWRDLNLRMLLATARKPVCSDCDCTVSHSFADPRSGFRTIQSSSRHSNTAMFSSFQPGEWNGIKASCMHIHRVTGVERS